MARLEETIAIGGWYTSTDVKDIERVHVFLMASTLFFTSLKKHERLSSNDPSTVPL